MGVWAGGQPKGSTSVLLLWAAQCFKKIANGKEQRSALELLAANEVRQHAPKGPSFSSQRWGGVLAFWVPNRIPTCSQ